MLKAVRRMFEDLLITASAAPEPIEAEHAYQLAAATLLVEMSRADFDVQLEELRAVDNAIQRAFHLSDDETADLVAKANAEADHATSMHEFTRLINSHFTESQKYHLIELLWQVAFADGAVDRYEEHFVRKIADLIYVRHSAFIRAKLAVHERRINAIPQG